MLDLESKLKELVEAHVALGERLSEPDLIANRPEYAKAARRHRELGEIVERYGEWRAASRARDEAAEMARDPDPEIAAMADEEYEEKARLCEELEQETRLLLLPRDPNDDKDVFLEIRAGTGGEEAGLFAADLLKMYARYGEGRRWKFEIVSANETGLGGYKEVIARLSGDGVYSRLKYESGVHRVQRVPRTEASGRIHTSAVTVAVMPEAEDVEIDISEADLRIDTYHSSGPGGQSVNTTDSAVRVTHLPTGLVVSCQDEKSQIKNRARAMQVLRARLYEMERRRQQDQLSATRRDMVKSGDRSEKIRTYNFPENRVTDHRIGLQVYSLDRILDGELDALVDPMILHTQTEQLKALETQAT